MTSQRSIYDGELKIRGFDEWTGDNTSFHPNKSLPADTGPVFVCMVLNTLLITFAFDENGMLWAAEGEIDLTDIGFSELGFEETPTPPQLQ